MGNIVLIKFFQGLSGVLWILKKRKVRSDDGK